MFTPPFQRRLKASNAVDSVPTSGTEGNQLKRRLSSSRVSGMEVSGDEKQDSIRDTQDLLGKAARVKRRKYMEGKSDELQRLLLQGGTSSSGDRQEQTFSLCETNESRRSRNAANQITHQSGSKEIFCGRQVSYPSEPDHQVDVPEETEGSPYRKPVHLWDSRDWEEFSHLRRPESGGEGLP